MFKWLFIYWKNNIDLKFINFKLNLWSYINSNIFKLKISNYITYFILYLNNLKIKKLKIFYKNFSFEVIYFKLIYIISLFIIIFCLI